MVVDQDEFDWEIITIEQVRAQKLRLWHGTKSQHLKSILATGLKAGGLTGNRHHTHMSDHPPGSNLNGGGCRFDAPIGIECDFVYILLLGIPVRKARNGCLPKNLHIPYSTRAKCKGRQE